MKNIITIDLGKLGKEKPTGLILAKDSSLALEAENELKKILDTQILIEKILEYVKQRLGEEMDKRKLIKVKGDSIMVSKRTFGGRYSLGLNPSEDFIKPVAYNLPNIETIDNFIAEQGSLPEGILLREREKKVSIQRREKE